MREQIEELSARLGADRLLVQGAGGNISWKCGDELWVKASGMCMRDAQIRDIFVPVNLTAARELELPIVVDPRWAEHVQLRPSIETTLHALMPHAVVVHVHSVALLSMLIMSDCERRLAALLQDRRHALVPYRKPGVDLAASVKEALDRRADVDVLFLANHGIVVAAETVEALGDRLEELLNLVPAPERQRPDGREIAPAINGFRPVDNECIHDLAFDDCAFDIAKTTWAITPDHVVFLGAECNTFDSTEEFVRSSRRGSFAIIQGSGVYLNTTESSSPAVIEEMLLCFRDVAMRVADPEFVRTLSDSDVAELLSWEAEKYRQTISSIGA